MRCLLAYFVTTKARIFLIHAVKNLRAQIVNAGSGQEGRRLMVLAVRKRYERLFSGNALGNAYSALYRELM